MTQRIAVRHNVEMAHRLFRTGGKCEQIHGHNWGVTLSLAGRVDTNGLLAGINFTDLKRVFRERLDGMYDHRILLNEADPFAGKLYFELSGARVTLPGLQTMVGDPTTENFARIIGEWAQHRFKAATAINVGVWETSTNFSDWDWRVGA